MVEEYCRTGSQCAVLSQLPEEFHAPSLRTAIESAGLSLGALINLVMQAFRRIHLARAGIDQMAAAFSFQHGKSKGLGREEIGLYHFLFELVIPLAIPTVSRVMACRKMIYLVWDIFGQQLGPSRLITDVAFNKFDTTTGGMRVSQKAWSDDSDDTISEASEVAREKGAILAARAGDQCQLCTDGRSHDYTISISGSGKISLPPRFR